MADEPRPTPPPSNWRKLGPGTAIPIVLLVGLLFVIANLHEGVTTGFTAPRFVSDAQGGFVFYDEGTREMAFAFRKSADGETFSKPVQSRGVLASAALTPDTLVTLFANPKDREAWFYALYERKTLQRTWCGGFADTDVGIDYPGHIAVVDSRVHVFGVDTTGALRVASLNEDGALSPLATSLPGAWNGEDPEAKRESLIRLPHSYSSAEVDGSLILVWRVATGEEPRVSGPGQVRYTRFDGESFGPISTFASDLAAPALARRPDGSVWLFGVPTKTEDAGVEIFALSEQGFERRDRLPPPEGRFQAHAGVSCLSAGHIGETLLLFAQAGTSIRYRVHSPDTAWDTGWKDFAQIPPEQKAQIVGWFGVLLLLGFLVGAWGVRGLRKRPRVEPALKG